jgi:hypothetical protein
METDFKFTEGISPDDNYSLTNIFHRWDKPNVDCQANYIEVIKSRVYLGSKGIGNSSNVDDQKIFFKKPFTEALNLAYELFAHCLTKETSSSSPSMMLHQLASLSLGIAIKGRVIFEENLGEYQPDLLIVRPDINILVDFGTDTLKKLMTMPDKPKMSIDKYRLFSMLESPFLDVLIKWSMANDRINVPFIMGLVKKQSLSNKLLYDEEVISFFLGRHPRANLKQHSDCAFEVLMTEIQNYKTEYKQEDPNKIILELLSPVLPDLNKFEDEYHYYCFPIDRKLKTHDKGVKEELEKNMFIEDGFLSYTTALGVSEHPLYEESGVMILSTKAYMSLMSYSADKTEKQKVLVSYFLRLANKLGTYTAAWKSLIYQRIHEKLGIDLQADAKLTKTHKIPTGFKEMVKNKYDFKGFQSCICGPEDPDPDHILLAKHRGLDHSINLLSRLRDYHELRFKSRIAIAIAYNRKPERCFKVSHWKYSSLHALVKIKGLVFEKDKGVVYVSYFYEEELLRTEKWRLPDIEGFSVAHHRLACCLFSYESNVKEKMTFQLATLYARIVGENSWGLSKFLKVYRYLSTGLCMSSSEVRKTCIKLAESVDKPSSSKLSFKMLMSLLLKKAKSGSIVFSKTPVFDLPFEHLGYESFLVNLCPSSTYGKLRHLSTTITELADEIDLYDQTFSTIVELFNDFKRIIKESDYKNLRSSYISHFRLQDKISEKTGGRFTFSPVSVLLLKKGLDSLSLNYKLMQGTLPPVTDLMTAKASAMSGTCEPALAIQTIHKLCETLNTTSTSLLALGTLEKLNKGGLIDLTMRMFDKDQVGGDREISILTSEFRVLQVVSERFFESFSKQIGVDKLHDKQKVEDLVRSYERSLDGNMSVCLTADQTRWGPNFNTITFGFLAAMLLPYTTESFLPMIICLLGEFKVFEMPCWVTKCLSRANYMYSWPGMLGRSHMGQGIFHQASSTYHSLVVLTLRKAVYNLFEDCNIDDREVSVQMDAFITSDDLASITYFLIRNDDYFAEKSQILSQFLTRVRLIYENIGKYLIRFGILTSKYKNIISEYLEFNQIHLGKKKIGSTDLKFCYSLIDPATTGNFIQDFHNSFDTYVNATNSLCTEQTSLVITNMMLIKVCRQWKLDFSLIGFPKDSWIKAGAPRLYDREPPPSHDDMRYVQTKSNLRFKLRKLLESGINTNSKFMDQMLKTSLMRMKGTRERTSYRSIITHSRSSRLMVDSPYFYNLNAIGETFLVYAREFVKDQDHLFAIHNPEVQAVYLSYAEERKSKKGYFKFLKTRDPVYLTVNVVDLVVSHFPKQLFMSDDHDKMILHMLRKHRTVDIVKPLFDYQSTSIIEAFEICEEKVRDMSLMTTACTRLICTEDKAPITYTKFVYLPPAHFKMLVRRVTFKKPKDQNIIRPEKRYVSNAIMSANYIKLEGQNIAIKTYPIGNPLPSFAMEEVEIDEVSMPVLLGASLQKLMKNEIHYRDNLFINVTARKRLLNTSASVEVNDGGKTMDEMLMDFIEALGDNDPFAGVDFEEEKRDEDDGTGGFIERTDDEMFKLISDVRRDELKTYSFPLRPKYGFITDSNWTLNVFIIESLLKKLIVSGVLFSDRGLNFDFFSIKETNLLTTDPKFLDNFMLLIRYSKNTIRQELLNLPKEQYVDYVFNLIDDKPTEVQLVNLLTQKLPNVTFTSENQGQILDEHEFKDLVVDMFSR